MAGAPAPISLSAINDYLAAYGSAVGRREFDRVIFALDDEFRARWEEKNKAKEK
ncbi:hypothetical protein D3C76_1561890 [compost metagenome]